MSKSTITGRKLLDEVKDQLLDSDALHLANKIQWRHLKGISKDSSDLYPIAMVGKGPPVLLIHGFDSSFLEFRRLVPLLSNTYQLIIPDLFGFGFCPRHANAEYGPESLVNHLNKVLELLPKDSPIGIIGASMGGSLAMEIARRNPKKINRLLLLSPAGLTGKPRPVPKPFDALGVWFLSQKPVRKSLCNQAFANPRNSVGPPEEQIASLHLGVDGWSMSLAAFARSGGLANCGTPLPSQPVEVIWGANDRILKKRERDKAMALLPKSFEELKECGHLPHLDKPEFVAAKWSRK